MAKNDFGKKALRNLYAQDIKKAQKANPEEAFFIEKNKDQIIAIHQLSQALASSVDTWLQSSDMTHIDFLSCNAVFRDCINSIHQFAAHQHGEKFANFLKIQFNKGMTSTGDDDGNQPTEHLKSP